MANIRTTYSFVRNQRCWIFAETVFLYYEVLISTEGRLRENEHAEHILLPKQDVNSAEDFHNALSVLLGARAPRRAL